MKLSKVEYGDVFQISLTKGCGFVQCVKEAPKTDCEVIRVLPGIYDCYNVNISTIAEEKELFFIQLPIKYAIKQNLLKYVGKYPVPTNSTAPRYFRTEHVMGVEFVGWYIVDSETLKRKLVKKLSSEEIKLSEWDIIAIPDLVERIESGWRPEIWI